MKEYRRTVICWGDYAAHKVEKEGWKAYFFTFMFNPLAGSPNDVHRQMVRELERVYATFVTRVVRHPHALGAIGKLPIFICAPDYPVFKYQKQSIRDVSINDGKHWHGLVLIPPTSRCRDIEESFLTKERTYIGAERLLAKIDIVPITYGGYNVVDYCLKGVSENLPAEDGIVVLPKALSELQRSC